ncbi:MAG: PHP domain-containing protein [Deltaproteobacteria bacterium]|nr:PHP domain-containing protein [Deltaproteobacteria bacterium]
MIRAFRCDLHVHTCLSPCAGLDMYPGALVGRAVAEKLDVIAICDHNASENVPYVIRAARGRELVVLPGMEVTSREEVHLLALFDRMDCLQRLQELVYAHLPGINDESRFGCQAIVNELDEVQGFNERLLIGATELALADLVWHIHDFGGLTVASHIDRQSFSVISNLGFVDPEIPFDALEISERTGLARARGKYPELAHYPFLASSDAHRIEEIGSGHTEIFLAEPSVHELKMAFSGQGGRRIAGC